RWLPNGRADALTRVAPGGTISLWFERRGKVSGIGYIEYSDRGAEFDAERMERQALLDAGPLFGELALAAVSEAEHEAVTQGRTDSVEYVTLGKRVVQEYIDPAIHALAQLLRDVFGQHWLRVPDGFDSRRYSLGQHSHLLDMYWQAADKSWHEFLPNERTHVPITVHLAARQYH